MRYERLEDLLRLAVRLQGTSEGLSLDEIGSAFNVSRRTAERMRDALVRTFPQVEELGEPGRQKRWRMPARGIGRLVEPTLDELTALHRAEELARREGHDAQAERLANLAHRLRANLAASIKRQFEPDLEVLLEAEGVARRPGPREAVPADTLDGLRKAILEGVWIRLDHRARATGLLSRNAKVGPLALLLGEGRQYLVGWSAFSNDVRLYALLGIKRIAPLPEVFERPADFDLDAYLDRAFGVFQEEPQEIVWRFRPGAATEARQFRFHASQVFEPQPDDSLILRFRAGGLREMAWHLFRWGDAVEILKPEALRDTYRRLLDQARSALEATPPD
ncbi:WYL domain-containing protein [Cereibacter sphaeroides]|uniref:helix-turn-helix transcriptional regulator n=1 Tax=Cereibacter sphaeroides TaxID=1063 RepID=UPI001F304892|nr:WYL domain-containing protein [Cereibacter sphaeroides]MCE6957603.1 WYL domain-containing protein [Cereibacter sphaeroides]MCE6971306.1 WYL domain-containing protein [Cereibacter sphaeroides]